MKTIKIIDLLNKIANGEELPKKIEYGGKIYIENHSVYEDCMGNLLLPLIRYVYQLNAEANIIEEKKIPEKIGLIKYCEDQATSLIHHKVDEIIDYLDYLESKEKGE